MTTNAIDAKPQRSDTGAAKATTGSASSLSLPRGGGAIRGMGEKFAANPVTGTGSMSVPVYLSPSRSDFAPHLSLSYDSGSGNGIFGLGWQLSLPSITRKTDKGIPQYSDQRDTDTFILSEAEDLVPVLKQDQDKWVPEVENKDGYEIRRYRPRVEGLFARIERWTHTATPRTTHWRVISKDNITSIYGLEDSARISHPKGGPLNPRIFKWLLSMSFDDKGNVICYDYKEEDGVNIPSNVFEKNRSIGANRYIKRIRYGNRTPFNPSSSVPVMELPTSDFMFEAVFDYGEHDEIAPLPTEDALKPWACRPDPYSNYRSGFEIRTYRLCRQILMFHHFSDEPGVGTNSLVRATKIIYAENEPNSVAYTFVSSIKQVGYKRNAIGSYDEKAMPAVEFEYTKPQIGDRVCGIEADKLSGARFSRTDSSAEWVDLYGEGLTGILARNSNGWYYQRNISPYHTAVKGLDTPAFESYRPVTLVPSLATGKQLQVMDLAGDGRPDLVSLGPPVSGFYEVTADEKIEAFQALRNVPNIDWNDPNLRFIDLTGDGHADILITEGDVFTWYPSEKEHGFGPANRTSAGSTEEDGPRVVFADYTQSIFLADMSGDGLTDIVRIRNGNVCYWPNLGYGKFGKKITMSAVPMFDYVDQFDPKRILLTDIDGTGTTDIIYFSAKGCHVYFNHSGNSLSVEHKINNFPLVDSVSYFGTLDLFGDGTACLVWSSPLPSAIPYALKYIKLMKNGKPHLLTKINNNMGAETEIKYAPSTKFYLLDRYSRQPHKRWVTKLPFPVHVVEEVVTIDRIGGNKLVAKYSYHHGYFDGRDREFRGFGMIETIDAETFIGNNPDSAMHVPSVVTKSWYHTGAPRREAIVTKQYEKEYWKGDEHALLLSDTALPAWLFPPERLDAFRALKGMPLRTEVYELGNDVPYQVTETNFTVELIQSKKKNQYAVFHVHEKETLTSYYEQNAEDPRIAHTLVLKADAYGRPELSATVVYPRRDANSSGSNVVDDEQRKRHLVITSTQYAADVIGEDTFRMGSECGVRTWEFTHPTAPEGLYSVDWLNTEIPLAVEIQFEDEPSAGMIQKRLVEQSETLFLDENLSGSLPVGVMANHGLPYESYTLAYTPTLLSYLYDENRITDAMLEDGGFILRDGNWWARSGRSVYDVVNAKAHFYLPSGAEDTFGEVTELGYDAYDLLLTSITDPVDNMITARNDYRTLSPTLITDPNGNRTAIETDALGIVIKQAVMGKENGNDGDTLDDPTAKMEYGFAEFGDNGNIVKPSWIRTLSRETHRDENTRWLQTVEYSDGLGRVALVKTQAAADANDNPRWVGTGRIVYNNKGNPVKQYEPYFSGSDVWESEPEIVEMGVTPILWYDPLARLIRTDFPDGTHSKVDFTAWLQKDFDRNDTSGSSPHYNTPAATHFDSLGRAFYVVTNNGTNDNIVTRTELDIEGNEKQIIDARGNVVMEYRYGIHGEKGYTSSMDAGERRMLVTVDGQPLYTWDSRGHRQRFEYDELRRPTKQWLSVDDGVTEKLVGKTVYGEESQNPESNNLKGKPWKVYDQSGLVESVTFDFKGNLLESKRQLTQEYKQIIDWNTNPVLENEIFTSTTEYDVQNRATNLFTPHNNAIPANEIMPEYDEGGLLKGVKAKIRGAVQETAFVTGITYNPKGQRERISYGNGATTRYDYDEKTFRLTRLLTTRNSGADTLQDLNYEYDPVGNIMQITDDAQQTIFFNGQVVNPSQEFEYDALYRLVKVTGREHASVNANTEPEIEGYNPSQLSPEDGNAMRVYERQWEYDDVGNILTLVHQANANSWTRNYTHATQSNRLTRTTVGQSVVNYDYNEHGSMVTMPHLQAMEWDFAERLSHITRGTTDAYYNYDMSGERVRKVVEKGAGIVETRLYLGGFEVFRKNVGNTLDLERETLHVMDDKRRIAMVETKTVENGGLLSNSIPVLRYQFDNHLGSASLEIDEEANIISYEEYYPYGDTSYQAGRSASEVSQKRYRYIGKEKDKESGLYYHGARYYVCWLGRWTAIDPAGLVDGLNLYMYCSCNPVKLIDVEGTSDEYPYIELAPINMLMEEIGKLGKASEYAKDKVISTFSFDIEKTIVNTVTNSAEMAHLLYLKIEKIAKDNPALIKDVNSLVGLVAEQAKKVTNLDPDTMGWKDLFNVWLFELGKFESNEESNEKFIIKFGPNASTTKDLVKQEGVILAKQSALENIKKGDIGNVTNTWRYGVEAFRRGISESNVATSFLGSYTTKVDIIPEKDGSYTLNYIVSNSSGWESGTRLRKDSNSSKHIGIIPDKKRGEGIYLGGTIKQEWKWSETINR